MRYRRDRFCQLAFWPTVEFDDFSTPAPQGNCQFWSESDDYVVTTSWSPLCDDIQSHSVFEEPDFCSVWEAQDRALLLSEALNSGIFDVEYDDTTKAWTPTWKNPIDSVFDPDAKSQDFCAESINTFDLPFGDFLAEPLSNSTTLISKWPPVFDHHRDEDDQSDDACSFMAAGPSRHVSTPNLAIVDQPTMVRQETDFVEDESDETTSDEEEEDLVWRDGLIFSVHHPPAEGVVNCMYRHVLLRNVARIAQFAFSDLQDVHQVRNLPPDLSHLSVYLAQHRNDLPSTSDLVYILADVEFHPAAPSWDAERVRCPIFVPPLLTRQQIFRALDVFQYSQFVQDTALVWLNDNLVQGHGCQPVQLCHGDFVRIALPPPLTDFRNVPTRCIARLLQMGVHTDDLEAFYWISDVDNDLDPMPTQRCMVTANDLSVSSLPMAENMRFRLQMSTFHGGNVISFCAGVKFGFDVAAF